MLNIKYHNKKTNKKISKKNRERTDVHGCTDIGGGWVSLVHENTHNGLQRSFASLLMASIGAE